MSGAVVVGMGRVALGHVVLGKDGIDSARLGEVQVDLDCSSYGPTKEASRGP